MNLIVNKEKKEYPDSISLEKLISYQRPGINDSKAVLCVINDTLVNPPYNFVLSELDSIQILPIPEGG